MAFKMGLIGKKLGMTQVFGDDGERIPVTVVQVGPCTVVAKRTPAKDKYSSLQLGFEEKKATRTSKSQTAYFAKAGVKPQRLLKEIRLADAEVEKFEVGQVLKAGDVFAPGQAVDVVGQSKGKGYQGVMKMHHMGGSRNTHGSHEFFRHGGSIGCRLTPGRVHKGKRMSRHMGDERKTVQNLEVVQILDADNAMLIRGAVPGANGGYVLVQRAVKRDVYRHKVEAVEEKAKGAKPKAIKK